MPSDGEYFLKMTTMYLNSVVINIIIFKDSTTADTACVNEPPSGWYSPQRITCHGRRPHVTPSLRSLLTLSQADHTSQRCSSRTTGRTCRTSCVSCAPSSVSPSLAVDHQRKVVKRTLGGDVVGRGGKSFTICGNFGLICGVYVVPDTALSWVKKAMAEVIDRHKSAGMTWYNTILLPISLFFSSQLLCLLVLFVCLIIIISLFQ